MIRDSEEFFDSIFLSYRKILKKLNNSNITTKHGKKISEMDLREAIIVMLKKHPTCRWRSQRIDSKRYYILYEGFLWLEFVYFQKDKSLIDADIDFFKERIKQYEELLNVEQDENWWGDDMNIKELCSYFNRRDITIRKAIKKMCDKGYLEYKYMKDDKVIISNKGVEWLSKNVFKQKYLELLEKRKMELTELYIKAGYPYDEFFGKN